MQKTKKMTESLLLISRPKSLYIEETDLFYRGRISTAIYVTGTNCFLFLSTWAYDRTRLKLSTCSMIYKCKLTIYCSLIVTRDFSDSDGLCYMFWVITYFVNLKFDFQLRFVIVFTYVVIYMNNRKFGMQSIQNIDVCYSHHTTFTKINKNHIKTKYKLRNGKVPPENVPLANSI